MSRHRERPADFDEVYARLKGPSALRKHYNCGVAALRRWLGGEEPTPTRNRKSLDVPDDFVAMANRMHRMELGRHYGRSHSTIDRWLLRTGVKAIRSPSLTPINRRPMPDDFAAVAPTMIKSELMHHYVCRDETLKRWLQEAGVEAKKYKPPIRETTYRPMPKQKPGFYSMVPRAAMPKLWIEKSYSEHDRAADVLRRNRWIVYRCDEKGLAKEKGRFWRCGNVICTPEELLERAAKYECAA